MGSRDRRRVERHKRKARRARRSAGRGDGADQPRTPGDSPRPAEASNGGAEGIAELAESQELSRSELKNQAAREALEPLQEGERPLVVTIGAVVSTVLFVAALAGWLLWDVLRDDIRPSVIAVLLFAAVVGAMAFGMWRARYWAVLGFQAVLLFSILGSALGIVGATTILEAIGNFVVLAGAGALFFFMVKALARIQMPERRPRN